MLSILNKVPRGVIGNCIKRSFSDGGAPERRATEKCLNQVTLLGRSGNEPRIQGSSEHPVVTFSVATNASIKNVVDGTLKTSTEWHRISCFKPAIRDSISKYLQRGTRVLVTGRISYGQIIDGNGTTHQTTSIIADNIVYLSNTRSELVEEVETVEEEVSI